MIRSAIHIIIPALLIAQFASAQCLISGLSPTYCLNSPASVLNTTVSGGVFTGSGINNSTFEPSIAGPGTHLITYSLCSTDYSVSQHDFQPGTNSGNFLYLSDNEITDTLPIGFTFRYFCKEYTHFYVSSNGFITFSASQADGCCQGAALPSPSAPLNMIAGAWTDLDPSLGGSLTYMTSGTAPYRELIVHYNCISHANAGTYLDPVTMHITLFETTNVIELNMTTKPIPTVSTQYNTTMGIQNSDGSIASVVSGKNGTAVWTAEQEMYRFTPGPYCVTSQSTIVHEMPAVHAVATKSTICMNEKSNIVAFGAISYIWDNQQTGQVISVSPTVATVYTVTGTDANGCAASAQVSLNVESCTGSSGYINNTKPQLKIFPNPGTGNIHIQADSPRTLSLISAIGQVIGTIELNGQNQFKVTVTGLSQGVYFVCDKNDPGGFVQKLVVLRD